MDLVPDRQTGREILFSVLCWVGMSKALVGSHHSVIWWKSLTRNNSGDLGRIVKCGGRGEIPVGLMWTAHYKSGCFKGDVPHLRQILRGWAGCCVCTVSVWSPPGWGEVRTRRASWRRDEGRRGPFGSRCWRRRCGWEVAQKEKAVSIWWDAGGLHTYYIHTHSHIQPGGVQQGRHHWQQWSHHRIYLNSSNQFPYLCAVYTQNHISVS